MTAPETVKVDDFLCFDGENCHFDHWGYLGALGAAEMERQAQNARAVAWWHRSTGKTP